jgi:hypothetical protein
MGIWLPPAHKGLADTGDVPQQMWRAFQIPVGSIDVDMTEIRGQSQHMLANALTVARARLKGSYGKGVPQPVKSWPAAL